jgi:hypothetical protein
VNGCSLGLHRCSGRVAAGRSAQPSLACIDSPRLRPFTARRLLFPARSFVRGAFSTALPYDLGRERVVLLLAPVLTVSGGPPPV